MGTMPMEIIMSIMIMQITELLHNLLLVVPNVRDLKVEHQALEMLPELLQDLMARDVLTRLKWWRRLSMMMLFSVTIAMTRDVTPLMPPTMSLNKKRTVKRTSEKPVSLNMSRLLSMRQSRFVDNLLSRIVIPLERRSVELNMSLNVGPSRRFMM